MPCRKITVTALVLFLAMFLFSGPTVSAEPDTPSPRWLARKNAERRDARAQIKPKHRRLMYGSAILVPLTTSLGLGFATIVLSENNPEYANGIAKAGATLAFSALLLSGQTSVFLIGKQYGYAGSFKDTLVPGTGLGLAGAAIGSFGLLGLVAVSGGLNSLGSLVISTTVGGGLGFAMGLSMGSVSRYARSNKRNKGELSWIIVPAPMLVESSRLSAVPGLRMSGKF